MPEDLAAGMSLEDAAAATGLEASYLRWALGAGLLQGAQGDDGQWYLPDAGAIAAAPDQSASLAPSKSARPVSKPRLESAETLGTASSATRASPRETWPEIARLRQQLDQRDARLAEKDRIIASLGTSLAKLGSATAERFS